MESLEDFLTRSTEILRAHSDGLWAQKNELFAGCSESIRSHRKGLRKSREELLAGCLESIRAQRDGLLQTRDSLTMRSCELFASVSETLIAEGLIVNASELLFERQRLLADKLRSSLASKLKIFIIFFLMFGLRRYHWNSEETDISLLFLVISVAAYYLHAVSSASAPPVLFYKQSDWMERLLDRCPCLFKPYKPTLLWGWSGHLQTAVLGKMGRSVNPLLPLVRRSFKLDDGATVYYDTFDPPFTRATATIVVVPGINNTSEKLYIKTFVRSCLGAGYRVVCLNHLGSLKDYPITSPRIFGYGHTEELSRLVDIIKERYPTSPKILLGFSMGGNVVTKYLGERPERQDWFVGVISACQGYDISKQGPYFLTWDRMARLYNWAITNDALKATFYRHSKVMAGIYDMRRVSSATCMQDFDACVMSKMYGYESHEHMYKDWSCSRLLDNIKIPMITLNAVDDPIIAPVCSDIAIRQACKNDRVLHIQTQCGGHLGYYTGGWIIPNGLSWLDTSIVEFCGALLADSKHQDEDSGDNSMVV
ncbi:monoacylglycerol lipase ABHD2-like [Bolinopsis microptera]|uniref:monoacylglycerol lipase ABHD2-like n=1 Tax=Bolinopsis microptera TaxID=2820187 RepID=UPI00307A81DB